MGYSLAGSVALRPWCAAPAIRRPGLATGTSIHSQEPGWISTPLCAVAGWPRRSSGCCRYSFRTAGPRFVTGSGSMKGITEGATQGR